MLTVHTAQLLCYHETLDPGQSPLKTRLLLELRKVLLFISIYFDKVTCPYGNMEPLFSRYLQLLFRAELSSTELC